MPEIKTIEELEELSPDELNNILIQYVLKCDDMNPNYFDLLLHFGASLYSDKYDRPFLVMMIMRKNINSIKILIESGVDVDTRDTDNNTSLHWAVHMYNEHLSDRLIYAESDLKDFDYKECIRLLLVAGASKEALNYYGCTPWQLAKQEMRDMCPELDPYYTNPSD